MNENSDIEGVLLEVSNILIGACVGKLMELLGGTIQFASPGVSALSTDEKDLDFSSKKTSLLLLAAELKLPISDLKCEIALSVKGGELAWIRDSARKFLEQY